jgi:bifunctional UDP-N-acetylglucosamine pyrophosphorylase / glucosamine-1-phosphate N-acetyltransferase
VTNDVAAIVLAAGKGTRFRSDQAKVLHRAAGRSLVGHVLEALRPLALAQVIVVVGHQADEVRAEVEATGLPGVTTVVQAEQRGTGHAVQEAVPALAEGVDRVLVLAGDTPLITSAWLERLLADGSDSVGAMLTAQLADPTGYGRVLRDRDGLVEGIVEEKDASPAQQMVREINAGMYVVERGRLVGALAQLDDDNEQGEIYLTDVVRILTRDELPFAGTEAPAEVIAGVNDRSQLAEAAAILRRDHLHHLMAEVGVSIVDPVTTYVDVDVMVGRDSVLLPGTILESGTRVGERAVIGPHTHLTGVEVGDDAVVHSTRGVDAVIGNGTEVGPFTHLRAGTRLGIGTKVGAYVETKNTTLGDGSKIPHLAYVGDATVGSGVNIACGVITVNYDGATKAHTTIEDGAFIGCDTMLVAPVTVGADGYTAAGSTITDDVPAGALGIARARQTTKEGWVARKREG